MFKRKIIVFLFPVLFFISCSEDNNTDPIATVCDASESTFSMGRLWAYTNTSYEIKGSNICKNIISSIDINGIDASINSISENSIIINIPIIKEDSATITINLKDSYIELENKIAVYPSSGRWVEKSPLPTLSGRNMHSFVANNKAFITGGIRYLGVIDGFHNNEYLKNLVEYDPENDHWSIVTQSDNFRDIEYSFYSGGKFHVRSYKSGFNIYDLVDNSFESQSGFFAFFENNAIAINDSGYIINTSPSGLVIFSNSIFDSEWQKVAETKDIENSNFIFNFAFENGGYAYIGTKTLNSKTVDLWRFNPTNNELIKISSIDLNYKMAFGIKHLFVVGKIAYFSLLGESRINSNSQVEVVYPEHFLFLYNLEQNEWIEMVDNNPVPLFNFTSFTLNNRGFMGFNMSEGSTVFEYSTEFWEFIPE